MLQAYQQAQRATSSPRETEYRVFAHITRALIDTKDYPSHDRRVVDAVSDNRKLWNALLDDLSHDGNAFPDELRAQLISIALWVGRHTSQVLRGEADVEPLIDVNRNIMEGLAQQQAS
jgi:flagellar protein FlaF